MNDSNVAESSAPEVVSGGAANSEPVINQEPKTETVKDVNRADHERALKDMLRYKSEAKEAQERIRSMETRKKEEAQEWEQLYRSTDEELKKVRGQITTYAKEKVFEAQMNAVRTEAVKHGIIELSDLESLRDFETKLRTEVTDTGRVIVDGADLYVEKLKNEKKHWFKNTTKTIVNSGGGSAPPLNKKLSVHDVNLAETKFRAGKMSKEDYQKIHNAYVQQKRS